MKLGTFLPQLGPAASPEAITRVAKYAEDNGFDSVWVTDRLLYPVDPKTPYAASPDGRLPEPYKIVYEPLEALLWAAAATTTIRIATSVLDMPFYNPILLAKRSATIDVLSGGRLTLGMGLGWSQDEYAATNADESKRGRRANEFLECLFEVWEKDPAEYHGKYFELAKSYIGPKPAQKPHIPVYLAAFSPGAMKRVAKYADGWHPVALPVPVMRQMWSTVKDMAKGEGRDPSKLKLSVRGNLHISDTDMGDDRWIFAGSPSQIKADVKAVRELGADELTLDPTFSPGVSKVEDYLKVIDQINEWAA